MPSYYNTLFVPLDIGKNVHWCAVSLASEKWLSRTFGDEDRSVSWDEAPGGAVNRNLPGHTFVV